MTKTKWVMKQYWRIGTIRALLSLALGMFVLGRLYYGYIPILADLGLIGALILGSLLVLLFMGVGAIYDSRAKMWSPKAQAAAERNPYQYVSNYKSYAYDYQMLFAVVGTLRRVFLRVGLDGRALDDLAEYLDSFFRRSETRSDIFGSLPDASKFSEKHPIRTYESNGSKRIPLSVRLKLSFEVEILRLNWIQALTGLLQDVLVFGALYVTVLFPDVVTDGLVPFDYLLLGILFLSLPLFVLLTLAGWYYDKKLRIWAPDYVVKIERNPYSYVPDMRNGIVEIPFFMVLFRILAELFESLNLDHKELDNIILFLEKYRELSAAQDKDMNTAKELRKELTVKF